MLDWLKSALAVFIMFAGMAIAGAIGVGFAMTCIALVTRAEGLRAHNPTSEPTRGRSPLHAVTFAPSKGDGNRRPMVVRATL